jgi:hypothetical protein
VVKAHLLQPLLDALNGLLRQLATGPCGSGALVPALAGPLIVLLGVAPLARGALVALAAIPVALLRQRRRGHQSRGGQRDRSVS